MIALSVVGLLPDKVVAELPFGITLKACVSIKDIPLIFSPFIPVLAFDVTAFALAVWRLLEHSSTVSRFLIRPADYGQRVYSVMAIDSLLYFVVMWATTLVDLLLQLPFSRDTLRILWDPMFMALGSTVCSRMVLNLKAAGAPSTANSETAVGSTDWAFKLRTIRKVDVEASTGVAI
ncbi:hypothetical protein EXIGLDRAFT_779739 [Exidia glandulosa HHB12029]|uniref:Uncharacterized protein n=1 Tax=Exidia glandulosa HHB12029 TaxID=1314781 RepID=A0A165BWT0_EXIGL|nr:hypothetical protein EXIGLDRAFT_779739 [Exidia glandulosa HHB12029]